MLRVARLAHDPYRGIEVERRLAIFRRSLVAGIAHKGIETGRVSELGDAVEEEAGVSAVGELASVKLFKVGEEVVNALSIEELARIGFDSLRRD